MSDNSVNQVRVAVIGACGRMGQEVVRTVLRENDLVLTGAVDVVNEGKDIGSIAGCGTADVSITLSLESGLAGADVVVDFTGPETVFDNTIKAINMGVRPVVGATGMTEAQLSQIKSLSEEKGVSVLIAPNFTIGALLMMMFAKTASKYFDNAEIIELHHNKKKDAPSGTAIKTAQLMSGEKDCFAVGNVPETELYSGARGGVAESDIHIHSVRMPGFMASQEVLFGSLGQVLTIRHDSFDRSCYMPGVVMAIRHVMKNNEFVYGLENIL